MTEKLILVRPSLDWEEELLAYKEAFKDEHMHGGAGLDRFNKMSDWMVYLKRLAQDKPAEEGWTATAFLCIRPSDKRMVGICNIRHYLNRSDLLNVSGHIGYSIRPDERRKGYAKEQLRLALLEAKKLGLEKVLVTCADKNIASERTILANGGVYEDSRLDESTGDMMKRYWINLTEE